MASGIENLLSATARLSVPLGRADRNDSPRSPADHPSVEGTAAAGRPVAEKENPVAPRSGETERAEKEVLVSLLKKAEALSLASRTAIYYARDEQSGRMYLYVKDRRTGEELYRIPKDYLPAADVAAGECTPEESPKVDFTI